MRILKNFALGLAVACAVPSISFAISDAEIKQMIIQQSQASYPASCPCPENFDRGGRRCGKRSAYSKPGGASPLCYQTDVSADMVKEFRKRNASD